MKCGRYTRCTTLCTQTQPVCFIASSHPPPLLYASQEIPAIRIVEKILYAADAGGWVPQAFLQCCALPAAGCRAWAPCCLPAACHAWCLPLPLLLHCTHPHRPALSPLLRVAGEAKEAMAEAQSVYGATIEQPAEEVAAAQ